MNSTPLMAYLCLYFFLGILLARLAYLWDRRIELPSLVLIAVTPPFGFIGWIIHTIVVACISRKIRNAGIVSMDP
jgi:hypothetical protein